MKNTNANKFGALSIGLHWLMLLLLVLVYASMELRGIFPKGSASREAMKTGHYLLGLSVFILVWIRLIARLGHETPAIQPTPSKWQTYLSQAVHLALYVFMIAMPLIGWMLLSAEGKPIPFFGLQLPSLIAENKTQADQIKEWHEAIGKAGYILVGLHAVAALFHHYVVRDNTLRRMIPWQ